ncbi:MAG: NAD-dependent dehydratase [Hydrogenophaga sp.]|uniref:NAD-dependent dehydratase n=1 Tax=Hydrogenophaga sp. TaxID=1904254 RepID=UPI0016BA33B5|nr:NAD-dependent dehydratase [Hydrogenophaga sp.]NIM42176.1 NAD-dependent dehydratase [Hydrogenophaga sp.]NIN27469.1 NAD-dependent dehydratase [Hydrogenophaga sp.]NIN32170.1 NAD-dependent dehydratase [Hydrogenophaga sp.]NIN56422.1 NAD-dependent dehydratase [Hydrogenophaga sp.]NIO52729.1 NAD-dependent dehydratase [Hydrogenophaga sp.]
MIAGATGLVGSHALRQALAHPQVRLVVAPTRRALPTHPKLLNPVVSFERLPEDAEWWGVNAVICTIGTTIKTAGSREAFYRVDHDLPLRVAELALRHGTQAYAFNSALGADLRSRVFYSRTKGEVERDLLALGYPSLTLVRPGLIGGERVEDRPRERLFVRFSEAIAPVLPRRWRVVPAEAIARTLLESALTATPGVRLVMSEDIT